VNSHYYRKLLISIIFRKKYSIMNKNTVKIHYIKQNFKKVYHSDNRNMIRNEHFLLIAESKNKGLAKPSFSFQTATSPF